MERKDRQHIETQQWEGNYNSIGRSVVDLSTTELSGTRKEADLIVRGLQVLLGQLQIAGAVTATQNPDTPETNAVREVTALLDSIKEPKLIEPPLRTERWI